MKRLFIAMMTILTLSFVTPQTANAENIKEVSAVVEKADTGNSLVRIMINAEGQRIYILVEITKNGYIIHYNDVSRH